jgi:hypothetical protein
MGEGGRGLLPSSNGALRRALLIYTICILCIALISIYRFAGVKLRPANINRLYS